jgi:hypothetical protein
VVDLSDPSMASIGLSEQMHLSGDLCGTLGTTNTRLEAAGGFDVLVVPSGGLGGSAGAQ